MFTLFCKLYVYDGSDYLPGIITSKISDLSVQVAAQFLLYATEKAALDYYTVSLLFDHVRWGNLFPVSFLFTNPTIYFVFLIGEQMTTDPVLVAFAFHRMNGSD